MPNLVNDGAELCLELAELSSNIKKLSCQLDSITQLVNMTNIGQLKSAGFPTIPQAGNNCVVRQEHGTDIDAQLVWTILPNTMKRDRQKAVAAVNP